MFNWQPTTRQYRYLIAGLVLLGVGGGLAFAPTTAGATADMTLGELNVTGVNETVGGNVSAVNLAATLDYSHDVPDATRRIIKIKVGPTEDDLELVDYVNVRDPAGTASGSVTLSGDVTEHSAWSASDFDPALANTSSQEIVVQAVIEVHRETGDVVRSTVTDTATVTLHDDATLTVTIGGKGSISVETESA